MGRVSLGKLMIWGRETYLLWQGSWQQEHLQVWSWTVFEGVNRPKPNPLQFSCLENPMDRGNWWVTVHGFPKNQTQLSDSHFHFFTRGWIDISHALFGRVSQAVKYLPFLTLYDPILLTKLQDYSQDTCVQQPIKKSHWHSKQLKLAGKRNILTFPGLRNTMPDIASPH